MRMSDWSSDVCSSDLLTDRMAGMLGREPDDLVGRHFVTLIAGGDDEAAMRPLALKTLAYQIESQAPFTDLVVPVMIDEQPRWWQLSAQPIIDEDGKIGRAHV